VRPMMDAEGLVLRHAAQWELLQQEYARYSWAGPVLRLLRASMDASEAAMASARPPAPTQLSLFVGSLPAEEAQALSREGSQ